jgi:2-polyprenyl-3-methyl-5-hydroxy-6-metoxy-1,4-benzoquinol methylase
VTADAVDHVRFRKYAESGAYHWREVGSGLIAHNAFTAERYRRVIDCAALREGDRVLDYGCGDGALLGMLHRRVGSGGYDLHGFDPNTLGAELAVAALAANGVKATIHGSLAAIPDAHFDRVVCTEVIEHVSEPEALLREIARVLKPGGRAVVTTPIRLTEAPEEPSHVREWFAGEFLHIFDRGLWRLIAHEQVVPAAAIEAYFWRPPLFARVPVFRLLCNLLSIYAGVNAMSWLRMRPRLFTMQVVVAEKTRRD